MAALASLPAAWHANDRPVLAGRQLLTMRNVALAALLVLLISPHALMQAGFQMSFAAVFALVGYMNGGLVDILSRMGRYFIALFVTSIIAGSVTGFLALYHLHQVAAYGLFANMLAMPIFGFVGFMRPLLWRLWHSA